MRDRESTIVTLLVFLMLTVWLGFLLHRSPRFAGSLAGGILGVSGMILMVVPLAVYSLVKRVRAIKHRITRWISMRTLLTIHIYTALIGSILALLHTGHKFDSPLGMLQTALMLLVVLSGFIGRYLMSHISQGIREKKQLLEGLQLQFEKLPQDIIKLDVDLESNRPATNRTSNPEVTVSSIGEVAGSIADVEYSISVYSWMKHYFKIWLKFHIVISGFLFVSLTFHVWSSVYFGLRWFQ